jgi:hypothetical protein
MGFVRGVLPHESLLIGRQPHPAITKVFRQEMPQFRFYVGLPFGTRQRSSVAAARTTCNETSSIDALSGGSNLATALSLNGCPYRATGAPRITLLIVAINSPIGESNGLNFRGS